MFLCIKVNILIGGGIHLITAMIIIKQIFEILVYVFFFYIRLENTSLIMLLMKIVICEQLILLGFDFAAVSYGKSQSPILTQIIKILFLFFLIFCRRCRIKEIDLECNNNGNGTVKNN